MTKDLNFVIGIGASKSGSTWLGDYFAIHPDICFSPRKELHYFDAKYLDLYSSFEKDLIPKYKKLVSKLKIEKQQTTLLARISYLTARIHMAQRPEAYVDYFEGLHNQEKYCSEISPNYSMLPEKGFAEMKKLLGNVKLIMLMRNPIDRHWSHLRFKSKKVTSFDHIAQYKSSFDKPLFYEAGNYVNTHRVLSKQFKKEDVLYLFYENLFRQEDHSEFQKIIDFLEIDYLKPNLSKRSNATKTQRLEDDKRKYGVKKLSTIYEYIFNTFDNVPDEWYKDYNLIS